MAIGMDITNEKSGEYDYMPVCSTATFREIWEPAAQDLGLEMILALPAL